MALSPASTSKIRGGRTAIGTPSYVLDEEKTQSQKQAYEERFKIRVTKLVWTHPLEYLRMIGWMDYIENYQLGVWYFFEGQKDRIIEALKNAIKLPAPLFSIGEKGERYADGKNRAYWSWKLGIEEIPVLMNEKAIKEKDLIQKIIDISGNHKFIYQPVELPYFHDWEVTQICSDRLETMLEYVGDVGGKRILDIGCFFGWFSHKLAKLGAKVTGIDVGSKKVDIARSLSACYGLPPTNPEFVNARYQDFLEKGDMYDIILYLSNFHHELRENVESAWRGINLISQHTALMFLDMDEYHVTEWIRSHGMAYQSIVWSPDLILSHSEFTKLTPLKPSDRHKRILYAFEKGD